jgi:LCP family protein required for cell wall assembly
VASVDPEAKKAALLSVPRDTRVSIDGHGEDKINHAFAFGGEKLSQSTVERFLGVPMDHYISVDVKAFERIVDAIGGIDIDVEKRMHYEDPWDDNGGLVIDLYPGEQHLDGKKAIQYVRYRDGEGDIGRIGRQQKFMKAVLEKVISPEILPRLPKIVKEVASAVETDMTPGEMLDFAKILKSVHDQGLEVDMVPGRPAYYQDISYWIPDIVGTRQLLAEEIGAEFTPELRAEAETAEKEYEQKLPKSLRVAAKETKKADEEDGGSKAMKPSEIHVMVINSSGINGAGAEIADHPAEEGLHHHERRDGAHRPAAADDHHDLLAEYGRVLRDAVPLHHPGGRRCGTGRREHRPRLSEEKEVRKPGGRAAGFPEGFRKDYGKIESKRTREVLRYP